MTLRALIAAALAIPVVYVLHWLGGFPLAAAGTLGLIGAAALNPAFPLPLDRLAGQALALMSLSGGLWVLEVPTYIFPYPGWIGGFVICQTLTFIIARRAPSLTGALIAGAVTAAVTLLSAAISHGWI